MSGETDGWGWPERSRKAHYFIDGRSLCGSWLYFGPPTRNQTAGGPDDCATCLKKLRALTPRGD